MDKFNLIKWILYLDEIVENTSQEMKFEILPCCTEEDTCTVYVQGEDMKMERTEMKSKKRTEYSPHSYSL